MHDDKVEDLAATVEELAVAVEQLATAVMAIAGHDHQVLIGRVRRSAHKLASAA